MYTFDDRDGRSVSLRPEGTASAVRAYIENAQWNKEPVTRWYYLGPMFRHERAQRGRLRQFHQIGAEWFGVDEPSADAETIAMLAPMLEEIGIPTDALEVTLNSLGEPEERAAYRDALVAFYSAAPQTSSTRTRAGGSRPTRCASSTRRTRRSSALNRERPGPARDAERGVADALRDACASCSTSSASPHASTRASCAASTTTRPRSSRSRRTPASSARRTPSVGGGRYDGLVASLGGPKTPAIGFALGVERMLLALTQPPESYERPVNVFFAPMDAAALAYALPLAHRLRAAGISVEIEHRGGTVEVAAQARRQAARPRRRHHRRQRDRLRQADRQGPRPRDPVRGPGRRPRVQDPSAPRLTGPPRSAQCRLSSTRCRRPRPASSCTW